MYGKVDESPFVTSGLNLIRNAAANSRPTRILHFYLVGKYSFVGRLEQLH